MLQLQPAFSSFSGFLPLIPLLGVALIMYPRVKIISIFYFFIVAAETALNTVVIGRVDGMGGRT